jgi:hypothetical protein
VKGCVLPVAVSIDARPALLLLLLLLLTMMAMIYDYGGWTSMNKICTRANTQIREAAVIVSRND